MPTQARHQRGFLTARAWAIVVAVIAGTVVGFARAQPLPDPKVTQYDAGRVAQELRWFESIGDGIVLTLAACAEEPHCATAMSRHELERLLDRIQRRIDHLQDQRSESSGGLGAPYSRLLGEYKRLRARYTDYLKQVQQVTAKIDTESLEQDWEELLSFQAKASSEQTGPQVPAPNKDLQLKRFADVTEPIPID